MSKKWKKAAPIQAHATPDTFRICASETMQLIEAAADASGPAKMPRFSIVAYTGVPMKLEGLYHPVVIDLEKASAPRQAVPVLRAHDPERIAGHTDNIDISAQRIKADGPLSGENEHSAEVIAKAKNGFPWQASIGAGLSAKGKMEFVGEGQSCKVNGRNWDGPLYVARGAVIREISILPMGADGSTSTSIAASRKETDMDFEKWLQARGYATTITDQEKTLLKAAYDFEQKNPPTPAAAPAVVPPPATPPAKTGKELAAEAANELRAAYAVVREEEATESARIADIRARVKKHAPSGLQIEIEADGKKTKVDLEAHAIAKKWTPDAVELQAMRTTRETPIVPGGHGYSTISPDVTDAVLEAACLQAGNCQLFDTDFYTESSVAGKARGGPIPSDLKAKALREIGRYTDQVQQAAHSAFKGRIGLQELLLCKAKEGGYHGSDKITDGNLPAVLQAAFRPQIMAEGFSTASISNVLANVQNKQMLQGYLYTEMTWRQITGIRPVKDFKPTKGINLLSDTTFKPLGPDGEIKHAALTDQAFANQATTYARMLAITRAMIINDDLSALSMIPMLLGRGWGTGINQLFWTVFMNPGKDDGGSTNFYAATHTITGAQGNSNLSSGPGSVLSDAGLTAAVLLFDNQVDPVGQPLGFDASILLYPSDLESTAIPLMRSNLIVYGGTTKTPNENRWANRFVPLKSRYLNKSAFTGNSTTAWYLLADPMVLPVIEVVFLNGQENPTVQTGMPNFDTLGIQMRGWNDAGVASQNFRGGVKNAGA